MDADARRGVGGADELDAGSFERPIGLQRLPALGAAVLGLILLSDDGSPWIRSAQTFERSTECVRAADLRPCEH